MQTAQIELPETPVEEAQDAVVAPVAASEASNSLDREAVVARIQQLLAEGRTLESLDACEVLGLTSERVEAAQAAIRPEEKLPPVASSAFLRNRLNRGLSCSSGTTLTVCGAGGRDMIKQKLTPIFEELGFVGIVELLANPGARTSLADVPDGMLLVQMADQYASQSVRAYGKSFNIARDEVVNVISSSPNWTTYPAPWNESIPAYAIKTSGNDGVGSTIVLLINLFGTPSGRFIRSDSGLDPALRAFREILTDAASHLTDVWRSERAGAQESPEDKSIAEMVLLVDTIKNFGASALGRLNRELEDSQREVERIDARLRDYERQMMSYAQQRKDLVDKIEVMSEGTGNHLMRALTEAVAQMDAIRNIRAVKNVQFTTKDGRSALLVELYDCSVKTSRQRRTVSRNRGNRILCRDLAFYLMLDTDSQHVFIWDNARKAALRQQALHPNIYSSGDTCWGELAPIITRQMANRNWTSVVNLAIRMVQSVGYPEASPVSGFPMTELPAGFQYPGRD